MRPGATGAFAGFAFALCFLTMFPPQAWIVIATLVGAILTLVGVSLTNLSATRRQRDQLKHDATQRERERQMALRKEIYLSAAESVSALQTLLMRVLDVNVSSTELSSDSSKHFATLGKIYVIGNDRTVRSIFEYVNAFTSVFAELMLKRMVLLVHKEERAAIEKTTDPARHLQTLVKQLAELLELLRMGSDRGFKVSALVGPALLAVRDELDLPIDQVAFLNLMNEGIAKNQRVIEEFIHEIERLIISAAVGETVSYFPSQNRPS